MSDWWSENMMGGEHILVDLGTFPDAAERGDKLREMGIGKDNFQVGNAFRLLVRIPPTKLAAVLDACPIREGTTYFGCTHVWEGAAGGDGSE